MNQNNQLEKPDVQMSTSSTNISGAPDLSNQTDSNRKPIPVVLLSGFLGAGKTTLLENILKNKEGIKCAVLVNDMAEINIDSSLITGSKLISSQEKLVEMHNGCICCTLREDLLIELRKIATSDKIYDFIVIESSGISEPKEVAETFYFEDEKEGQLNKLTRLDNCVTVVDSSSFLENLTSLETTADKKIAAAQSLDDKEIGTDVTQLLVDQVEFANLILLNKTDLVNETKLKEVEAIIKNLNPEAQIFKTRKSNIDIKHLLFTNNFKDEFAFKSKGWMSFIETGLKHVPETLEYGIGSFVYRADYPFHPKRICDWIDKYFILNEDYLGELEEENEEEWEEVDDDDEEMELEENKQLSNSSVYFINLILFRKFF